MLPNSPNVVMAAERAAELSDKKVVVVPTRSQQAGLCGRGRARSRPRRGRERARRCTTRSPTCAPAPSPRRRATTPSSARRASARGDAVGFVDEQIVAWGEPAETLEAVLGELGREAELLTLIAGRRRAARRERCRGARPRGRRVRVSTAASRATGGCSRPSSRARSLAASGRLPARRHHGAAMPRAFASLEPLTDADAERRGARRASRARRASPAAAARVTPAPAAKGAERLGLHTVGDLLEHLPRDRSEARTIAELAPDEVATVVVEVRSITLAPGAPARHEAARRGRRGRRDGDHEGDVLQPAVAGAQVPPGHAADAPGQVPGAQPLPGPVPRADDASRRGAAGDVATYPATEGLSTTQIAALVREHRDALRDVVEPLPARMRAAGGWPTGRGAWPRRTSATRRAAARRLAFEELLLLQLALLRRRALRREAARAEVLDAPRGRSRRAGSASRSRSRPPTTSARRWPRSTRTSPPAARCSGC